MSGAAATETKPVRKRNARLHEVARRRSALGLALGAWLFMGGRMPSFAGSSNRPFKNGDASNRLYKKHPFPDEVRQTLKSVVDELDKAGIPSQVKESPGRILVEEHGFDVIRRFCAQTYFDLTEWPLTATTAMVRWNGTEGTFKIFHQGGQEEYQIENTQTYSPFHLLSNDNGYRLASLTNLASMSILSKDLPLDLGDGVALRDGMIIDKAGDPRMAVFYIKDLPEDLGTAWKINIRPDPLLLPKGNPIATFKTSKLVFAQGQGTKRKLVHTDNEFIRSAQFVGEPLDYKGSLLINTDDGFQLVSRNDLNVASTFLDEPPKLDQNSDYVTAREGQHKRVILLSEPNKMSPPFDEVVRKTRRRWVVSLRESEDDGSVAKAYFVFSPDQPQYAAGPYTIEPPLSTVDDVELGSIHW